MPQSGSSTLFVIRPGPHPAERRADRGWRGAALRLGLLSFLWLSLITGAHHHTTSVSPPSIAGSGIGWSGGGERSAYEQPDDCAICQTIADAGAFLVPDDVALGALRNTPVAPATVSIAVSERQSRSHGWLSRAPPTLLHA